MWKHFVNYKVLFKSWLIFFQNYADPLLFPTQNDYQVNSSEQEKHLSICGSAKLIKDIMSPSKSSGWCKERLLHSSPGSKQNRMTAMWAVANGLKTVL